MVRECNSIEDVPLAQFLMDCIIDAPDHTITMTISEDGKFLVLLGNKEGLTELWQN